MPKTVSAKILFPSNCEGRSCIIRNALELLSICVLAYALIASLELLAEEALCLVRLHLSLLCSCMLMRENRAELAHR